MIMMNQATIPNLKVVTLNFWGIRYISKDVELRLKYLIKALKDSDYDIIALQEIWSFNDYQRIKNGIVNNFPYSHYYQSGLVGSGCCIFSRHHIEEVLNHTFSLNGYPHKINHSDWFAGKLVGLAVIRYCDLLVNVYVTHLHANYSLKYHLNQHSDEYLAHRITQLFELGQFISKTGRHADMCLLLGDLNTLENEFGYKLLRSHAHLLDAFKEQLNEAGDFYDGTTCNNKSNIYTASKSVQKAFPEGSRIDYIMYKFKHDNIVQCLKCRICFSKIEETTLNYSDHEGVFAEFEIKKRSSDNIEPIIKNKLDSNNHCYLDARSVLLKSIDSISTSQIIWTLIAFLSFLLLFFFNNYNEYLTLFKNFILTIFIFYSFIFIIFIKSIEKRILNSSLDALNIVIKHKNSEFNKLF